MEYRYRSMRVIVVQSLVHGRPAVHFYPTTPKQRNELLKLAGPSPSRVTLYPSPPRAPLSGASPVPHSRRVLLEVYLDPFPVEAVSSRPRGRAKPALVAPIVSWVPPHRHRRTRRRPVPPDPASASTLSLGVAQSDLS